MAKLVVMKKGGGGRVAINPDQVSHVRSATGAFTDVFFDGAEITLIPGQRHPDGAAHGSGCTHSSALAAHLARGFSPLEAATRAKAIAAEAVRTGLRELGAGPGPVDVFDLTARAQESPAPGHLAPISAPAAAPRVT